MKAKTRIHYSFNPASFLIFIYISVLRKAFLALIWHEMRMEMTSPSPPSLHQGRGNNNFLL